MCCAALFCVKHRNQNKCTQPVWNQKAVSAVFMFEHIWDTLFSALALYLTLSSFMMFVMSSLASESVLMRFICPPFIALLEARCFSNSQRSFFFSLIFHVRFISFIKVNILKSKLRRTRSLKADGDRAGALWERYDSNVVSKMRNSLIKSKELWSEREQEVEREKETWQALQSMHQ